MNFRTSAIFLSSALLLVGCAHHHVVETMPSEGDTTEAKVDIGSKDVNVGDKLDVFKRVCTRRTRLGTPGSTPHCQEVRVGEAQVTKLLDENHSIVKPEGELKLEKSMSIKRK